MDRLSTLWSGLSAGRRTIVILATAGMFAAVLALGRGAGSPDMALLYSGLEDRAAGDVVAALEQRGVAHDVRGSAIYVPAASRDALRMALAAEGMPANSAQGYELLDQLTGFGTTSQMFDAAYWRAKEGELARTILASPYVRSARVHISTPSNRPFQRDQTATAAVTVGTVGRALTPAQANALRYLVASAVSGLAPENVAVIDGEGGLIDAGDDGRPSNGQAMTEDLRARAQRLLEARVGYGNAIVEISLETVTETESIRERMIDPASRVAISTEVEERSNTNSDSRGGDVTVASNLPAGDAAGGGGQSTTEDSETRNLTNYEVSETSREVLRAPGAVRRLTVAVLVNDAVVAVADGVLTSTPRPEDELAALGTLVGSAVGLDEARGDVLTIRSMAFEPIAPVGTEAVEAAAVPLNMMTLIQIGVLAGVALILGLFVVRPILSSGTRAAPPLALPGSIDGLTGPQGTGARIIEGDPVTDADADPVVRLRRMIEERQDETLQILQSWVEDPDEAERA